MKQKLKHIIFDWGDTLMCDDPTVDRPMYLWETVEAVDDAGLILKELSELVSLRKLSQCIR